MCDFKTAAGPEAAITWKTLSAAKNIEDFATKYADLYDMDSASSTYLETLFTVLLGIVDEDRYYQMCAAFGGATKDTSLIKWITSELWDANKKDVVAFLHPHISDTEMKKKLTSKPNQHGDYLFRFHSTQNAMSFTRVSEKSGKMFLANGKLTTLGVGKGWCCAEKKSNYSNLVEYLKARGVNGEKKLLRPILRPQTALGPQTTVYAPSFDDDDDDN